MPPDSEPTTENTPLIRPSTSTSPSSSSESKASPTFIITLIIFIIITLGCGDELIGPAQTRVYESIYCRRYYEIHDPSFIGSDGGDGVAEKFCKIPIVQGEVAMLKGWGITFDGIGSKLFCNVLPKGSIIMEMS
jgi:hypothetical protein